MDIFGLKPVDSALAILGLSCSQNLTEFLFFRTPVGLLAFTAGFLWALWESIKEANFRYFVIFVLIVVVGTLLFLTPKRQAPMVKSAQEVYGISNTTTQSIKDTHGDIPTVLSFIGQTADVINLGLIRALDQVLDHKLRFLNQPFGPQRLSLEANAFLYAPIKEVHLKEDLDNFIYAHYLPSLMMYCDSNNRFNDLHVLWPGDERVISYYSNDEKKQWEALQGRLKRLINDPQGPWVKVKDFLGSGMDALDDQIMASLIRAQLQGSGDRLWWHTAGAMEIFFPYIMGCVNFCIYATFPLLMLTTLIVRRMSLFLRYAEIFLWVKSLYLTSAASYYISLLAMRVQAQTQHQINWFWDYPYFSIIASMLLYVLPIFSWIALHQGFEIVNHRR